MRAAIIALAMAAMVAWTWGTWPDPFIDFGRELYAAWRLSAGDVLHEDLAWFNGPLSPYLNALWFRSFGTSLRTLVLVNLALSAVLVALVYRVCRSMAGPLASTAAALTFIGLFGYGQLADLGNYNFVTPYSHELTHGVLLAFGAFEALRRYLRSPSRSVAAVVGLLTGLTALTKVEVSVATAAAVAVGLFSAAVLDRRQPVRRPRHPLLIAAAAATLVLAVAFLSLGLAGGWASAREAITGPWRLALFSGTASMEFYQRMSGRDAPLESALTMVKAAGAYAVLFLPAAGIGLVLPRQKRGVEMAAGIAFVALCAIVPLAHLIQLEHIARPFPIFLACGAVYLVHQLRARWREPDEARRLVLPLTMTVFALLLLGKVVLNVKVHRYGFALAMPATMLVVLALLDWIPRRIRSARGVGGVMTGVALTAWVVVMGVHLAVIDRRMDTHQTIVGSGGDAFLADERGPVLGAALAAIQARVGAAQTLVVLPEGAMLNYLARRASGVPFVNFLPPEFTMFGEDRVLHALQVASPDFVALVDRPTQEYGVAAFGQGYGEAITAWIDSTYEPVATIAPARGGRFGIRLMTRRSLR